MKKHFEEIIALTNDEYEYIRSHFKRRIIKRKRYLLQAGDKVTNTFWVKKGLLVACYHDESGKEHVVQFAMENWWITDYPAYFSQGNATLSIESIEDCEVYALSFDDREKICKEFHKVEYFFRKKANSGYAALQRRMLSFLSDDIKGRYELLLKQYPALLQRVPKSIVASYLGVSRETLSRLH